MRRLFGRALLMIVALGAMSWTPPAAHAAGLANKKISGLSYRDTLSNRTIGEAEMKNKVVVLYFWTPRNQDSIQGFKPLVDMQDELDKKWFEVQKAAAAKKEPVTDLPVIIVAYNLGGSPADAMKIAKRLDGRWIFVNGGPPDQDQLAKFATLKDTDIPLANVQDKSGVFMWAGKSSGVSAEVSKMLGVQMPKPEEMPDNPAGAAAAMREAMKLVEEKGEFTKALELVGKVSDKMLNDPSVVSYAAALLVRFRVDHEHSKQIEKAMAANPEAARKLKRMGAVALAALQGGVGRGEPPAGGGGAGGAPAAGKVGVDRDDVAAKKLEEADRYNQSNEPENAYPIYKDIVEHYPNSPAAVFAAQRIAEYEKNPQVMKRTRGDGDQRKAQSLLMAARALRDGGRDAEAREAYGQLLDKYPDSAAATEAIEDLKVLK